MNPADPIGEAIFGGPAVTDPDARAVLAAFASPPSPSRRSLIQRTIRALKAAGVWAAYDGVLVLAAHDAQAGRVDWKAPARVATAVNSPTFSPDRGYTFDGSTNYLNTGFIPNSHAAAMTGTSVGILSWERNNVAAGTRTMGVFASSTSALHMIPRSGSDGKGAAVNSNSVLLSGSITDSRGLSRYQRESNDAVTLWKGGVQVSGNGTPSSPATVLTALTAAIFVGGYNTSGNLTSPRASEQALVAWGARLTAEQAAAEFAIWNAYLSALGAA